MQKRIVFKNMDHSPVLEQFAQQHLAKVETFLENERTPIYIDLVLESYPNHAHIAVRLIIKTPHYDLVAHHEGPDMYQEINTVIEKMMKELRNAKEKFDYESKHQDSYKGA
jgi:ribosomal subunit interface protein